MHHFDLRSQQVANLQARIQELETELAAARRGYNAARDEVREEHGNVLAWMSMAVGFFLTTLLEILMLLWVVFGR